MISRARKIRISHTSAPPGPLNVLTPQVPLQKKEGRELAHGFVFFADLSPEGIFQARSTAEAFSDSIARVHLQVFYGSLANTLSYFQDLQHLHENVSASFGTTHNAPLQVVAGAHLFRTFIYGAALALGAKSTQISPQTQALPQNSIAFANANNLTYRKFLDALSWDEWYTAVLFFVGTLNLKKSECAEGCVRLRNFCEQMQQMRFEFPAHVPTALDAGQLERRFGRFVARLWCTWQDLPHPFSKLDFVNLPAALSPLDFVTTHQEVEPYCNMPLIPLSQTASLLADLVYKTVQKLSLYNGPGVRYGLQNFLLELQFDSDMGSQKRVELIVPVFERTKSNALVLEHVAHKLPQAAFEMQSEKDPSFFVSVSTLEKVTLRPLNIACSHERNTALFADESSSNGLLHAKTMLSLRGRLQSHLFCLQPHVGVQQSFGTDMPASKQAAFDLFANLYKERPVALFKKPFATTFSYWVPSRVQLASMRLFFSEKIADEDYFVVTLPHKKISLWVRSKEKDRLVNWHVRPFVVLGFFDSDFSFLSV